MPQPASWDDAAVAAAVAAPTHSAAMRSLLLRPSASTSGSAPGTTPRLRGAVAVSPTSATPAASFATAQVQHSPNRRPAAVDATPPPAASSPVAAFSTAPPPPTQPDKNSRSAKSLEVFHAVGLVMEAAATQPARPLRELLSKRPQLPIRESYQYRILVNLLWYARNYVNAVLLWALVACAVYPLLALNLLAVVGIHAVSGHRARAAAAANKKRLSSVSVASPTTSETDLLQSHSPDGHQASAEALMYLSASSNASTAASTPVVPNPTGAATTAVRPPPLLRPAAAATTNTPPAPQQETTSLALRRAFKALQGGLCLAVISRYGFFGPLLVSVPLPVLAVALHAGLTPYTDEAASHFERAMRAQCGGGGAVEAPSTPVLQFETHTFAETRQRLEAEAALQGGSSNDSGSPMAAAAAAVPGIGREKKGGASTTPPAMSLPSSAATATGGYRASLGPSDAAGNITDLDAPFFGSSASAQSFCALRLPQSASANSFGAMATTSSLPSTSSSTILQNNNTNNSKNRPTSNVSPRLMASENSQSRRSGNGSVHRR